ncbi:hypothetical protein CPC08DRAFT_148652 [Agrocybe pediades]|nr:hypothetical protein CPC08DRAFT_148652 [Agrocybe pediades]
MIEVNHPFLLTVVRCHFNCSPSLPSSAVLSPNLHAPFDLLQLSSESHLLQMSPESHARDLFSVGRDTTMRSTPPYRCGGGEYPRRRRCHGELVLLKTSLQLPTAASGPGSSSSTDSTTFPVSPPLLPSPPSPTLANS